MKPRRLLVLTYYYPPQPGSGSNRWGAMVAHLRAMGHDVGVITAAAPGISPGAADGVLRTASLNASPMLRRLLLRDDRAAAAPSAVATQTGIAPPWVWRGIVPDPWLLTWNPYAWRALRRHVSSRRVDCLITSSPAESTHLLALSLGHARPAWVADLRDGWGFEPLRERFPTSVQRAIDRRLEHRAAVAADVVTAVTVPIVEDVRERLGADALHVPNGFDPGVPSGPLPPEYDPDQLTLVHTGPLLGPRGRDPRPFLQALRRLLDDRPGLAARVRLLVAGRSEFDEQALLRETGAADVVRHLGYLPRAQALALQRSATALVLLTSPARSESTGKLYEYLAAGRPIIALAAGNEAARIVTETGTGRVVAPDDAAAITLAIADALSGELERTYAPHGLAPYRYPAPAERMMDAVERAIETRTQSAAASLR